MKLLKDVTDGPLAAWRPCLVSQYDLSLFFFLFILNRMTRDKLERFEKVFNVTSARILTKKGVK